MVGRRNSKARKGFRPPRSIIQIPGTVDPEIWMDLITGVRPRPAGYALWLAFVQPDVLQNRERLRVGLSAYSQRDDVCARIGAAPAPSSAEAAAASAAERLRTKGPVHPVDSLILRSVEGADRLPRGIGDRD